MKKNLPIVFSVIFGSFLFCVFAQNYDFVPQEYRMLHQEDYEKTAMVIKPGIMLFNEHGDVLPVSQIALMTNKAYRPRFFVNANNDIKAIVFENKSDNPIRIEKSLNDNAFLVNEKAPDFIAFDMEGNSTKLSELHGKVVVLNFWFIKCAPCVKEMPELNTLKAQFKNEDVVFLAVTFDSKENVNTFLNTHLFNYTLIPNASNVIQINNVRSFPTNVVLDKNGVVVFQETGYRMNIKETLAAAIKKALN